MPLRVLHVLNSLEGGGAETFIMNVYRFIDKDKFQFDFLLRSTKNRDNLVKEIEQLGGKIYIVPSFPTEYFKNKYATKKFFEEHGSDYIAVHVHANALIYTLPSKIAFKKNMVSIVHSHSTKTKHLPLLPIHLFNKAQMKKFVNVNLACSEEAGKWMFGKEKYKVVYNAIDVIKFSFNSELREQIRDEFQIGKNTTVVGHVGRFVAVKNHEYLIDIFEKYQKINKDSVLLLVGGGALEEKIKEKVKNLKLEKKVIFAGVRHDMHAIYQIMDILVFPSHFEGLPFALIEAQASGLKVLSSENVSREVDVTNTVTFFDLAEEASEWANKISELLSDTKHSRYEVGNRMIGTKYDISANIKLLEDIYIDSIS